MNIKKTILILISGLSISSVFAGNGIDMVNKEPVILSNIDTVGFSLIYEGDDNNNAVTVMKYREDGKSEWIQGHPLFEIKRGTKFSLNDGVSDYRNELAGRMFYLLPGKTYEVKVTVADPDGVTGEKERHFKVKTRFEPLVENKTGGAYYVSVNGSDKNPGTKDLPFLTIEKAAEKVKAGDTVIVREGVYSIKRSILIENSGTEDKPVVMRSEVRGKAVIDGSDTELAKTKWEKVDSEKYPDVYKVSYRPKPQIIFYKDNLMFPFDNIEDVRTCIYQGKKKTGLYGGWFWDKDTLYVKIPKEPYTKPEGEGIDPNGEKDNIKVVRAEKAFELKGNCIVIDGFTIRYVNEGINFKGANYLVLRNNTIERMINGIISERYLDEPAEMRSSFALIENNEITCCPTFFYRDWGLGHDNVATQGIMLDSGEGHMIRNNNIHDVENGIYVGGTWEKGEASTMANPDYNQGTIVAGNEIYRIGDDSVESDGACHNQVIYNNFIRDIHTGLSLAPNSVGPMWVLRNRIYMRPRISLSGEPELSGDFMNAPFKFNVGSKVGAGPSVIYHNTVVVESPVKAVPAFVSAWGNTPGLDLITRNNSFTSNPGWYTIYIESKAIEKRVLKLDLDYDNLFRKEPPLAKFEGYKKYLDLKDFQESTGYEKHGMSIPQKFNDPAKGDFGLDINSPLIDSGVILPGINTNYTGKAPDIGAVEF